MMEWGWGGGWGDHTASAHLCVFVPFRFPLSLTFRRARNSFDYHDVTSGTPHLTPAAFSMEFPLVWSLWFNWWWRIPQMARSTMWLRTSVVPLSTSGSPQYHFSSATHTGWPCQLAMRPPEVASRDIPSEKIGQNIHPPESCFFVVNYQHWTGTCAFQPFLAPLDHWGGLGGPG